MKLFTVLEPPDGKLDRVAFIREGFAWAALAFTWIWALWHRMWVVAALFFALSALLSIAVKLELLGPGLAVTVNLAIALLFAFEARDLQVKSLERVGFRRAGLIQASTRDAAELAYFACRAPIPPEPAPSRVRAAHDDTLGIFGNV